MVDMEELSLKDLEDLARQLDFPKVKNLGNGLYQIDGRCITNEKGLEMFDKDVRESLSS